MGRFSNLSNQILLALPELNRKAREKVSEGLQQVYKPKAFEKWTDGPEDRMMQVLSLFLIGPVIVVSLVCIVVINEVMAEIFGLSSFESLTQQGLMGWFVTGITAGMFILAAWSWFQFVRTYGFGIFRWD